MSTVARSLRSEAWFVGQCSRDEGNAYLKHAPDGGCIVRESQSHPGQYTLTYTYRGELHHWLLMPGRDGQIGLKSSPRRFLNLADFIHFYSTHDTSRVHELHCPLRPLRGRPRPTRCSVSTRYPAGTSTSARQVYARPPNPRSVNCCSNPNLRSREVLQVRYYVQPQTVKMPPPQYRVVEEVEEQYVDEDDRAYQQRDARTRQQDVRSRPPPVSTHSQPNNRINYTVEAYPARRDIVLDTEERHTYSYNHHVDPEPVIRHFDPVPVRRPKAQVDVKVHQTMAHRAEPLPPAHAPTTTRTAHREEIRIERTYEYDIVSTDGSGDTDMSLPPHTVEEVVKTKTVYDDGYVEHTEPTHRYLQKPTPVTISSTSTPAEHSGQDLGADDEYNRVHPEAQEVTMDHNGEGFSDSRASGSQRVSRHYVEGLPKNPEMWTTEDVTSWLERTEYKKYTPVIEERGVDGKQLLELVESDFVSMGFVKAPSHAQLLRHVNQLKLEAPGHDLPLEEWNKWHVREWLLDNNWSEHLKRFADVDGPKLKQMYSSDLRARGVYDVDDQLRMMKAIDALRGRPLSMGPSIPIETEALTTPGRHASVSDGSLPESPASKYPTPAPARQYPHTPGAARLLEETFREFETSHFTPEVSADGDSTINSMSGSFNTSGALDTSSAGMRYRTHHPQGIETVLEESMTHDDSTLNESPSRSTEELPRSDALQPHHHHHHHPTTVVETSVTEEVIREVIVDPTDERSRTPGAGASSSRPNSFQSDNEEQSVLAPVDQRQTAVVNHAESPLNTTKSTLPNDETESDEGTTVNMKMNLRDFTVEETRDWLIDLHHGDEAQLLFDKDVDGQQLVEFTEEDLVDVGITDAFQRERLLRLVKEEIEEVDFDLEMVETFGGKQGPFPEAPQFPDAVGSPIALTSVTNWDTGQVAAWLTQEGYSSAIRPFKLNAINGSRLLHLTREDLEEMAGLEDTNGLWHAVAHLQQHEGHRTSRTYSSPLVSDVSELQQRFSERKATPTGGQSESPRAPGSGSGSPRFGKSNTSTSLLRQSITRPPKLRTSVNNASFIGAPVMNWSIDDVTAWLLRNRYTDYRRKFKENGIDGPRLIELNPEDIEAMGLEENPKFLENLQKLKNQAADRFKIQQSTSIVRPTLEQIRSSPGPITTSTPNQRLVQLRRTGSLPASLQSSPAGASFMSKSGFQSPVGSPGPRKRYNWWQIGKSEEEALKEIDGAGTGAFVIYNHPREKHGLMLAYNYHDHLEYEEIAKTKGNVFSSGYHLTRAFNQGFSDLHKLVEFYSSPRSLLKCPLTVSIVPDPRLKVDDVEEAEAEAKVPKEWMLDEMPKNISAILKPGLFHVCPASALDTFILCFRHGRQTSTKVIKRVSGNGDVIKGFCLDLDSGDAFSTLLDLVTHYSVSRPDLPCPLFVDRQDISYVEVPEECRASTTWSWCQMGVPHQQASDKLKDINEPGAFVVQADGPDSLSLLVVQSGDVHTQRILKSDQGYCLEEHPASFYQTLNELLYSACTSLKIIKLPVPVSTPQKARSKPVRVASKKVTETPWSWWQLDTVPQEARRILEQKNTGAFVIYRNEMDIRRFTLSYVCHKMVYDEDISPTPKSELFEPGFHLENAVETVFPTLHALVEHFKEPHPPLKCALRVSLAVSPDLQP